MPADTHPPVPGPFVQPNFQPVMEAVAHVAVFPISKPDLLEKVSSDDISVLLEGQNVDLHELIKDIHDDFFQSESEFLDALERHYTSESAEPEEPVQSVDRPPEDEEERFTPSGEVLPPAED